MKKVVLKMSLSFALNLYLFSKEVLKVAFLNAKHLLTKDKLEKTLAMTEVQVLSTQEHQEHPLNYNDRDDDDDEIEFQGLGLA